MAWVPECLDNFNRANGNVGNGWTGANLNSAFQIASNAINAQNSNFTTSVALAPMSAIGTQKIKMSVALDSSGLGGILSARFQSGVISGLISYIAGNLLSMRPITGGSAGSITGGEVSFPNSSTVVMTLKVVGSTAYAYCADAALPGYALDLITIAYSDFATGVGAIGPLVSGKALDDFEAYSRTLTGAEPKLTFEGDSITQTYLYPEFTAATDELSEDVVWTKIGADGQQLSSMITDYPTQGALEFDPAARVNVALLHGGTNDIGAGASAATVISRITTLAGLYRATGFKVIVSSIIDRNDASWIAEGGRAKAATVNAWLDANWASIADGYANYAGDALLGASGAADNLTYFNADKVHPKHAAARRMANVAKPVVETILAASIRTGRGRSAALGGGFGRILGL